MVLVCLRLFLAADLEDAECEVGRVALQVSSLLRVCSFFQRRLDRIESYHLFIPSQHTFRHGFFQIPGFITVLQYRVRLVVSAGEGSSICSLPPLIV